MKTLSILAYALSLTYVTAQSLRSDQTDFVVTIINDTLPVSIILPSAAEMPFGDSVFIQDKLIASTGMHAIEYRPGDIKAFQYHNRNYESIGWKQHNGSSSQKFCQRILSGEIEVFRCNMIEIDASEAQSVVPVLCLRRGDELKIASLLHLSQLTGRLMTGYPAAMQTPEVSDFNPAVLMAVVRQYNEYQKPKTSH